MPTVYSPPVPTYAPLQTITLTSTDSNVVFSSIPNSYRDLIVVVNARSESITNWRVRFNSDSAGNYSFVVMNTNGSSKNAPNYSNETFGTYVLESWTATASTTQSILQIIDYSATDKYKSFLARTESTAAVEAFANRWAGTAAIHTIDLFPQGASWSIGSTFSLYGIEA